MPASVGTSGSTLVLVGAGVRACVLVCVRVVVCNPGMAHLEIFRAASSLLSLVNID